MLPHKLPAGGQQLTISTTAISLKDAIEAAAGVGYEFPEGANTVIINVESYDLRYSYDGNDPSTNLGQIAFEGANLPLKGVDLTKVKLIRDGANDSVLNIAIQTTYAGEF